jgi:TolB-like protein
MKGIITICFGLLCMALYGQDAVDTIHMLDGGEKKGKVTGVGASEISFVYAGEDLTYEISKSEIHKIDFASGRTEIINKLQSNAGQAQAMASMAAAPPALSAAERKNKLAVLPFAVTTNDEGISPEELGNRVQTDCIGAFRDEVHMLDIQDPMTTNAMLAKNNISPETIRSLTPQEMAEALGVEYVVYGSMSLTNKGTNTYGSGVTTYKEKNDRKYDDDSRKDRTKGTAISSGSSSTTIEYDERVELSIYNDKGESVYSDSKRPFGSGMDGYTSSLKFLVKRTPFGSKYKN